MAPQGSRTSSLPLLASSVVAVFVVLLIVFHSNINSVFGSLGSSLHQRHRIATVFTDRAVLENLSPSANEDWERALLTPKGGFLWVQYNVTAERPYGISMFHALHCLKLLREVIQNGPMVHEAQDSTMKASGQGREHVKHLNSLNHVGHCIGYIAQV